MKSKEKKIPWDIPWDNKACAPCYRIALYCIIEYFSFSAFFQCAHLGMKLDPEIKHVVWESNHLWTSEEQIWTSSKLCFLEVFSLPRQAKDCPISAFFPPGIHQEEDWVLQALELSQHEEASQAKDQDPELVFPRRRPRRPVAAGGRPKEAAAHRGLGLRAGMTNRVFLTNPLPHEDTPHHY